MIELKYIKYVSLGLILNALSVTPICAAGTHSDQHIESSQLQACLRRADDLPDLAAAEANAWLKRGGGNEARLCYSFAEANRGMHAEAAQQFWTLATYFDKRDAKRAVLMHILAGQEFMLAKDVKDALSQYSQALKIKPDNAESLLARAQIRMTFDRYWDAIDDLNQILKNDPRNIEALKERGHAWIELGNTKNAQEDFEQAELLSMPQPSK